MHVLWSEYNSSQRCTLLTYKERSLFCERQYPTEQCVMRQLFSTKTVRSSLQSENDTDARISVKVPYALRKRFRSLCVEHDTSMSDVMAAFVEIFVSCGGEVEIEGSQVEGSST